MIRVTGTLSGDFVVANAGTKAAPIALCGDAVLAGPSLEHGYTLHMSDGVVADNWFDGTGMVVPAGADSWVDVKGNGWQLVGNHGVHAPVDGFQTHVQQPGWGQRAVFRGNHIAVGGRGYGFRIAAESHATVVACDNDARDTGKGASNIRCTP